MSKYKNKKVEYEGKIFDSQMEADYYKTLRSYFSKEDIKIQPVFELQEKFTDNQGKNYRAISYTADFQVGDVVYDVKGMLTQQGELRIKMFKYKYPFLYLKVITKAPKYTQRDWIDIDDLKKLRKQRKNDT